MSGRIGAAMIAVALVGCTGTPAGSPGPDDGDISGPVRVTFIAYDEKMQPWLDEIKQDFESKHPGVQLTLEIPSLDTYRDSLTTQAAGGTPPDIAQVATSWLPALADADVLLDWQGSFDAGLLDRMNEALRDGARYRGTLYGLSYGSSARAVFYNVDTFAAAGVQPPSTWDEFLEVARRLKSTNAADPPFFYEGRGQEAMAAWFPYVYFTHGGELADGDGNLAIDRDACIRGLTIWDTMNREGLIQDNVTASDFTQQMRAMTSGEAGMTISGPWAIGMYASDGPDTNFDTFPIPTGTTTATVGVTDAYIFFKDSQNPAAARAFAEYVMEPDTNLRFIRDRGFLPVYAEHFSLPEFTDGPYAAFTAALPNAKFVPIDPDWVQFDRIGTDAITAMFLEGSGPERACQAMVDGLASLSE